VADILNTVTGMQVANNTGPGSVAYVSIQGSDPRHVLVMIDGVSQNNLGDGFPDVGSMRVQQIERIEIVKGPASSSWGSSLGGIVNIITKTPDDTKKFTGTASASIGDRATGDYRGEISGTIGSFGYYLAGGGLLSDGLQPGTNIQSGNIYSKLNWNPTKDSSLTFTIGYDSGNRTLGQFQLENLAAHNRYDNYFTTLNFNQVLTKELSFDLSLRASRRNNSLTYTQLISGLELLNLAGIDTDYGGSARLHWDQGLNNLTFGSDVDFGKLESQNISGGSQRLDKWALYLNDTLKLGRFSVTPGIRYDHTNTNGDFWSPSLGATCTIADSTILRGYVARGFSIPPLGTTFATGFYSVPNPNLKMERVWSYSLGFETAALTYVWLKSTYFHHDVSDAITTVGLPDGRFTSTNAGKLKREGVEVELKTMPVFHLSLTAGFTFINIKNESTGEVEKDAPRYVYDVGIQYDDSRFLLANLKGRLIDWNSSPGSGGKNSAMIWDLNLSRKFNLSDSVIAEAFFTAHNLFNGASYNLDVYQNPRRWFEGGLRFSF
jgi:vitamin B12 transporter